jgi:hypothetical protein
MEEITLDDKTYVSSKRAAKITGYAKDYVGQLCREGKVEARLVGRNWYVLESSIREHRFGAPKIVTEEAVEEAIAASNPKNSWEVANYTPDVSPELLPTLIPQQFAPAAQENVVDVVEEEKVAPSSVMPAVEVLKPELKPLSTSVVQDMQSAWQDWFTRTDELKVSKEVLLEESYAEEPPELLEERYEEANPQDESTFEPGTTAITIDKVLPNTMEAEKEETVPIKRSYSVPVLVPMSPIAVNPVNTESFIPGGTVSSVNTINKVNFHPQGRVIRERRITVTKNKPSKILQILLVLIGLAAVITAIIGSGFLDTYVSKYNVNFKVYSYLAGESLINK